MSKLNRFSSVYVDDISVEGWESKYEYIYEPSKSGDETFKAVKDGKIKYIHSKYDPIKEAKELVENINIKNRTAIVCFGVGLGYHIEQIIDKLKHGNLILVFDPDLNIINNFAQKRFDIVEDERFELALLSNYNQVISFMHAFISEFDYLDIEFFALPSYTQLFLEEYSLILEILRDFKNSFYISRNTVIAYHDIWQEKFLENFKHTFSSYYFTSFKDKFTDLPLIIVSAGPSLNKNVHLLKEAQGKIPIICVYTAYKVLKKHGIKPDFVVAIDALQTRHETNDDLAEKIDSNLLYKLNVAGNLITRFSGNLVLSDISNIGIAGVIFEKLNKDMLGLEFSGSVATVATSFADFCNADPIILIGQDLCFTGGKTHASGTFYDGKNNVDPSKKMYEVEDIYGEMQLIDQSFHIYKKWFDSFCTRHSTRKFIDATEGGAKIAGTEIMTLREALDQFAPAESKVDSILSKVFEGPLTFTKEEQLQAIEEVERIIELYNKMLPEYEKAEKTCNKLFKIFESKKQHDKPTAVSNALNKLDKIDKKSKDLKVSFSAIDMVFRKSLYEIQELDVDGDLDQETYILKSNEMAYGTMKKNITEFVPKLEKLVSELKEIAEENSYHG